MIKRLLQRLAVNASRDVDLLARQIAENSAPAVLHRVAGRTARMTLCETRGYIRARAAVEIRNRTRAALVRSSAATADQRAHVIRRATDRVVPLVLRQLAAAEASAVAPLQRAA